MIIPMKYADGDVIEFTMLDIEDREFALNEGYYQFFKRKNKIPHRIIITSLTPVNMVSLKQEIQHQVNNNKYIGLNEKELKRCENIIKGRQKIEL